jgi:hypothetical protein
MSTVSEVVSVATAFVVVAFWLGYLVGWVDGYLTQRFVSWWRTR